MTALKAAKTDGDPVPDLQQALKRLNRATNDKGGKKEEAISLVNEAITLEQNGDTTGANEKIDHAISEIYAAANHVGGW